MYIFFLICIFFLLTGEFFLKNLLKKRKVEVTIAEWKAPNQQLLQSALHIAYTSSIPLTTHSCIISFTPAAPPCIVVSRSTGNTFIIISNKLCNLNRNKKKQVAFNKGTEVMWQGLCAYRDHSVTCFFSAHLSFTVTNQRSTAHFRKRRTKSSKKPADM